MMNLSEKGDREPVLVAIKDGGEMPNPLGGPVELAADGPHAAFATVSGQSHD